MNSIRMEISIVFGLCSCALFVATSVIAAPAGGTVTFTPPLASAQTIQVTETIYERGIDGATGPLKLAGTMKFKVMRPDEFRIEWKSPASAPATVVASTPTLYVSDGTTTTVLMGKHYSRRPTSSSEWPFPLVGLLNNAPPGGPVTAAPALRSGRSVLVAVRKDNYGRTELTFDPATHLLLSYDMFVTYKGKTIEAMRTDYSGWVLDGKLPSSTFQWIAPAGTRQVK